MAEAAKAVSMDVGCSLGPLVRHSSKDMEDSASPGASPRARATSFSTGDGPSSSAGSSPRARAATLVGAVSKLIDATQISSMKRVFDIFDDDGGGTIDKSEIMTKLIQLNLLKSRKVNAAIMDIVDADGDGEMDFEEFADLLGRVKVDDGTDYVTEKLTEEEKAAQDLQQEALAAFQRAVAILAFQQMSGDTAALREEVLQVLDKPADERTEWELQQLLMWAEGFDFIQKMPPASESNVRVEVCRNLTVFRAKPGKVLCKQGEKGDTMWIVMHGSISIVSEDVATNGPQEVAQIGEGKSFGELAVMGDEGERQRIATCIAKEDGAILGMLHRDVYRRLILRMHEEAKREVRSTHPPQTCLRYPLQRCPKPRGLFAGCRDSAPHLVPQQGPTERAAQDGSHVQAGHLQARRRGAAVGRAQGADLPDEGRAGLPRPAGRRLEEDG